MYTRSSRGSRTDPWCTPLLKSLKLEQVVSEKRACFLFDKYDLIKFNGVPADIYYDIISANTTFTFYFKCLEKIGILRTK